MKTVGKSGPSLGSYIPSETKTIPSRYNYAEIWMWMQQSGRQIFGERFTLHEDDKAVIYMLLCYFLHDEIAAPHLSIDLGKGVLLAGPVGVGKTSLMTLVRCVSAGERRFVMKSCRDISFEFIRDGYEVIHRYSRGPTFYIQPQVFCFDDLGTEGSLKYYGNECNVMAEILLTRYDLFCSQKLVTHITTNLSASEIEGMYGNRLRSRMREMFNLISFDEGLKDKRV